MTVCLNPACPRPENPDNAVYCQSCGAKLLLNDRYRILQLIGQGGFGRTFLATDTQATNGVEPGRVTVGTATDAQMAKAMIQGATIGQCIAHQVDPTDRPHRCIIKQLLPQITGVDARNRSKLFQQEVAQLAQLGQHPQIPKLLAHFENETGQYLVQEFVAGQNLDTVLATQGVFIEAQVRKLLADLLPVLRFIHNQQVVHRDIKPANIICPSPTSNQAPSQSLGRYVLVDFGAAKSITATALARTGTMIGSAGYAAPEQAMGKATFASDLYSLGVTCIHLLTGLHPFDLYSISDDRWIWRQYLTQPISVELRRVLDTLLQRATSQRYRTATTVLQELRLEVAAPLVEKVPIAVGQFQSHPTPDPKPSIQWHCRQILTGHHGEVTAIALSPNGELIASGSTDKTIRLWSFETGKLLYTLSARSFRFLQGHQDRITGLAFSPSSEVLISSSADGTIKQWDVRDGSLFSKLQGGWGVSAIALNAQDPLLVSGSEDGLIQFWDLEHETRIANLAQLNQPITALVVDPTGHTVWSSHGKTISQWDLHDDRLLTTLKGHAEIVTTIALSRDGCTLISGGNDKLLKLWNLNTGQQQKVIAAHRDRIHCLAVHPNGDWFASSSEDGMVKLWDIWTGQQLAMLRHAWSANSIAFSSDGEWLVSGSSDETIRIWQKLATTDLGGGVGGGVLHNRV